jgi:hypothetical protein
MSEGEPRPFSISINRCTESDYEAFEMRTQQTKRIYTPQQEFEHLKAFKGVASYRIKRQKVLISKIKQGKIAGSPKIKKMLRALAEYDLKHLNNLDEELQQRTAELRRKIHEESINGSRPSLSDDA